MFDEETDEALESAFLFDLAWVVYRTVYPLICLRAFAFLACSAPILTAASREIPLPELSANPTTLNGTVEASGTFTWWLPGGVDALVLPVSAGVVLETTNAARMQWLKEGSPWELKDLPVFGARCGARTLTVIVPWPHYAELVVGERIGVRFQFPERRTNATPCQIVAQWSGNDPLDIARAFRHWRETANEIGAIPRPRTLRAKATELPATTNLFGAPHFYLWGPALFSRHDVSKSKWIAFARALHEARADSLVGRVQGQFSPEQRDNLKKLAAADWPEEWRTSDIAAALNAILANRALLALSSELSLAKVVQTNSAAFAAAMREFVSQPETWGDGFSLPMLESLQAAGIDRALLLLSDLYGNSPRPDVAAKAAQLGYLTGPYDSYHSVHSPDAAPDTTWETAQFDRKAYEQGQVQNADGAGHGGFKGRGYHFAPAAAWPYLRQRVGKIQDQTPYSSWFMDCDATAECFDDFNPLHPATRVQDIQTRRERLRWLETERHLVVGSEGGSVLFADVIHFGHGIQTPYVGHLSPEFSDPESQSFLGRHWPAQKPASSFKPVRTPRALLMPYFDPLVRIPLYQAALGDELIVSHHWSFDSLKLNDVAGDRALLELLYLVPPMYHLNRETWPQRKEAIIRHFKFWSPVHRAVAGAPLTRFQWLTPTRELQRTTFRAAAGDVTMTVNFSEATLLGYLPKSATVAGAIMFPQASYRVGGK